MSEDKQNESVVGSGGRTIIISLVGSLVMAAFWVAWQSPRDESRAEDQDLRESINALQGEVRELREAYSQHRINSDREIGRLAIQVEAGGQDRFTGTDNTNQRELLDQRWETTKRDIEYLKRMDSAINQFLTDERRANGAK